MEGYLFQATGLEHTEKGTPDYSPEMHQKMTETVPLRRSSFQKKPWTWG
jgi:hypothetical protein